MLLAAQDTVSISDVDDSDKISMTIRISIGCRAGEDELFLSDAIPATSLQTTWVGEAVGSAACTLTVTPAAGTSSAPIADWIEAMKAIRFRALKSLTGNTTKVSVRLQTTDTAAVGAPNNGGSLSASNQSNALTVVPFPHPAAEIPSLLTNPFEECPGSDSAALADTQQVL